MWGMGVEVVCTARCGIIRQEQLLSEGSRPPVAMQPLSERTRRPQFYSTSIRTHQAPGAFLADSLRLGARLLHPTHIFFLLMYTNYLDYFQQWFCVLGKGLSAPGTPLLFSPFMPGTCSQRGAARTCRSIDYCYIFCALVRYHQPRYSGINPMSSCCVTLEYDEERYLD